MSREPSPEIDDELFNEVYGKEYTGPTRPTSVSALNTSNSKLAVDESKNGNGGRDVDMAPDPNAVPTDFTSREARVWEAKSKAMERNWKRRKEEEMICKLCGEAGHFTQGCPSTLGANRKRADFFERVPARDRQVRSLFTDKVIAQIEKDVGCRIKLEEKFLIVSAKDGSILSKGVDAVHKLIQDDKNKNSPSRAPRSKSPVHAPMLRSPVRAPKYGSPIRASRSRSPIRLRRSRSPVRPPKSRSPARIHRSRSPNHVQNTVDSYFRRRSERQRPHSSPKNPSSYQGRFLNQDRVVENRVREDLEKFPRDAPYGRAYANDGPRGQLTRSRSPAQSSLIHDHGSFDSHKHNMGMPKHDNWSLGRHDTDFQFEKRVGYPNPRKYEELELEFERECMEFSRIHDHEEEEENTKHRECLQGLREGYLKKLDTLRSIHMKLWEDFLQRDIQMRNQQIQHSQPAYLESNQAVDPHYSGTNLPVDSRNRPSYLNEELPASMQHNFYGADVQAQRNDEFRRTYGRY